MLLVGVVIVRSDVGVGCTFDSLLLDYNSSAHSNAIIVYGEAQGTNWKF